MVYITEDLFEIRRFLEPHEDKKYFIEVDELIAPIIQVLNLKGYKTIACCSGHPYEVDSDEDDLFIFSSYILFEPGIILPSIPEKTDIEIDNRFSDGKLRFLIRRFEEIKTKDKNYYRCYNRILNTMKIWMKWANELPEYNKEEAYNSFIKLLK